MWVSECRWMGRSESGCEEVMVVIVLWNPAVISDQIAV